MKLIVLLLISLVLVCGNNSTVDHLTTRGKGTWGTVSAMITAGSWIWKAKDYIASCGGYKSGVVNGNYFIQWSWVFTKGTYVIGTDGDNYVDSCDGEVGQFNYFINSKYNVLEGIKSCESGMIISNDRNAFINCVQNVFEKQVVNNCNSQCLGGCPKFRCT